MPVHFIFVFEICCNCSNGSLKLLPMDAVPWESEESLGFFGSLIPGGHMRLGVSVLCSIPSELGW